MGAAAKHRRKITVNGENYVWHISPDDDSPFYCLNIISEDKRLVLCCPLKTGLAYVISKGRVFQGRQTSGCWERYLLPFCIPKPVTPKFVSELIRWAAEEGQAAGTVWNESTAPV